MNKTDKIKEETCGLIDVFPDQGCYAQGDKVKICVQIENKEESQKPTYVNLRIMHLHKTLHESKELHVLKEGMNTLKIEYQPPTAHNKGYGVQVQVGNQIMTTAFDVLDHWNVRPRYGFLSDFYQGDEKDKKDLEQMNKYHINVVQFYDWMYKHEDLIPKEDYFVDLLDRRLSKIAVLDKIDYCHQHNMGAIGYGCIYATSKPFYEAHQDWALYTNDHRPQNLGDWFYIMDIEEGTPWFNHIIGQFKSAIEVFDFDGLHLDTYGFPRTAYAKRGDGWKLQHLDEQFGPFINATRRTLAEVKDDVSMIFNAVSNWGIESVADSDQGACYIEVWDPQDRYRHLWQLIHRARELGNKQVILAAYLKCFEPKENNSPKACLNSLLFSTAVIGASGGFHLVLGENNGVLCDPYYVNYGKIDDHYVKVVRNYYDFLVRYGDLLYDLEAKDASMTHVAGINTEYILEGCEVSAEPLAGKVWAQIRETKKHKALHLINLQNQQSDIWNEAKPADPQKIEGIKVKVLVDEEVEGVYFASPDGDIESVELNTTTETCDRGQMVCFEVPEVLYWSMVYIKLKG